MINKIFIKEAKRIRKDYFRTIQQFNNKENILNNHKNTINEIIDEINVYIEKNPNKTESDLMEEKSEILINLEISITKIQDDVKILDKKLKKLENDSSELYQNITEHHPELSKEEIQKEIFYSLDS